MSTLTEGLLTQDIIAPINMKLGPLHNKAGQFLSGRFINVLGCSPRDSHLPRAFLLRHALMIDQTYHFIFFQLHILNVSPWILHTLETVLPRHGTDTPALRWSGHFVPQDASLR
jgi:hypothetical protein